MFRLFGRCTIRDLAPEEVAEGDLAGTMLRVDGREPSETASERIHGALLSPLARFDALDPQGRAIVFISASGMCFVKAAEIAQAAGLAYDAHLDGGIKFWNAAGLPLDA
jgi:rhodanese-related sulfurtransferase